MMAVYKVLHHGFCFRFEEPAAPKVVEARELIGEFVFGALERFNPRLNVAAELLPVAQGAPPAMAEFVARRESLKQAARLERETPQARRAAAPAALRL